jgi:hypothetical protein
MPEASGCKCLGIIACSNLRWADQVNYTEKRAWKALHILKGNSNTKSLAGASNPRIWGGVLESLEGGVVDTFVRLGANDIA